jgi:hypothetical protein
VPDFWAERNAAYYKELKKSIACEVNPIFRRDRSGQLLGIMVGDTNDSSSPAQRQTSWCVFFP